VPTLGCGPVGDDVVVRLERLVAPAVHVEREGDPQVCARGEHRGDVVRIRWHGERLNARELVRSVGLGVRELRLELRVSRVAVRAHAVVLVAVVVEATELAAFLRAERPGRPCRDRLVQVPRGGVGHVRQAVVRPQVRGGRHVLRAEPQDRVVHRRRQREARAGRGVLLVLDGAFGRVRPVVHRGRERGGGGDVPAGRDRSRIGATDATPRRRTKRARIEAQVPELEHPRATGAEDQRLCVGHGLVSVAVDLHPDARRDLARAALLRDALPQLLDVSDVHRVVHVEGGRDVLEPLDEGRSRRASILRAHVRGQRQRRSCCTRTDPRATDRHSPSAPPTRASAPVPRAPPAGYSRPPIIRAFCAPFPA
jgi:hypothetical protein